MGEPLSTGKITEDLDRIIEAGRRPEATAAEKANAERAKAIRRGFEDDARKLNDLAKQRLGFENQDLASLRSAARFLAERDSVPASLDPAKFINLRVLANARERFDLSALAGRVRID